MTSVLSYITAPIIGGIIGYITNDIAIRMLFRPHTAKYIFGVQVPFTPGIIPKEKGRIAEAIGSAISENLMNKEVLEKYLLSDEMVGKINSYVSEYIERQKTNHESVKDFLCHYFSEEEVLAIVNTFNENISKEISSKLTDPKVGDAVAKVAMDHVGKSLSCDGAKILLKGIGGFAKGIKGIASSLLGVDIVDKFLSLLRDPAERFLANNINTMLAENGKKIVSNMLGNELNTFLDKSIATLLQGHEEQLDQLPHSVESIYRTVITEHLPRILDSIDIRRIVSERINEMDVDETETLIFHIMDKELNAIVWLGAALGTIMGCLNLLLNSI